MYLPLSPEVSRLRRMAKACAAGELSRRKYRQARRELIIRLQGTSETTDRTLRRSAANRHLSARIEEKTERRLHDVVPDMIPAPRARRKGWRVLVAVLVCLLVPVLTFSQTIPTVQERDPSPARSQRLAVTEVSWEIPAMLPEIGAAEVATFLAAELESKQVLNDVAPHGFTVSELDQVGRFLNAVGVHDRDTSLTRQDMQDLAALIDAQKQRRGVSLLQIEEIAQALEQWLHSRGYPVAAAYVPAQKVSNGVVHLGVAVGVLSEVQVASAAPTTQRDQLLWGTVRSHRYGMQKLVGEAVRRNDIETRLNVLNRSPQRSLQAGFKPGSGVGETEMLLQVNDVRRLGLFVQADNYGSDVLGEERLSVGAQAADLLLAGDSMAVAVSSSVSSGDQLFGMVDYTLPLDPGRRNLRTRVGFTDVQVSRDLSGDGWQAELMLEDTRLFTRASRREFNYGIGFHNVQVDFPGVSNEEQTTFISGGFAGHQLWDANRFALQGDITLVLGMTEPLQSGFGRQDEENFWLVKSHLTGWSPLALPLTWAGLGEIPARLVLGARMQSGSEHTPTTFKFNVSQPVFGTGLPTGSLQLDEAVGVNSALRMESPVGDYWVYTDFVYGERDTTNEYFHLTTLGLGWEADLRGLGTAGDGLSSRVTVGVPVSHKSNGDFADEGIQLFWSLRYRY